MRFIKSVTLLILLPHLNLKYSAFKLSSLRFSLAKLFFVIKIMSMYFFTKYDRATAICRSQRKQLSSNFCWQVNHMVNLAGDRWQGHKLEHCPLGKYHHHILIWCVKCASKGNASNRFYTDKLHHFFQML